MGEVWIHLRGRGRPLARAAVDEASALYEGLRVAESSRAAGDSRGALERLQEALDRAAHDPGPTPVSFDEQHQLPLVIALDHLRDTGHLPAGLEALHAELEKRFGE